MREIKFTTIAFSQLEQWQLEDKKVFIRIEKLLDYIQTNPFTGIGKPEPLKFELSGYWSRRITKQDRLIYKITTNEIIVISCKYHY